MRPACLAALLGLAGIAPAQDGFAALYRRAEEVRLSGQADAAAVREAYAAAARAFLLLPDGSAERAAALPAGAFAAWQAGQAALAADLCREARERGPEDAFLVEMHVRALSDARREDDALRVACAARERFPAAVTQALRGPRGPWDDRVQAAADRLLRQGETELGIAGFELLAEASGRHPIAVGNLALACHRIGRSDAAERLFAEALARDAADATTWNDLGIVRRGAGRFAAAAEAFREGARREAPPGSGSALHNLVSLSLRTQEPLLAEPMVALRQVLQVRPETGLARRLALDLLTGRERWPLSSRQDNVPPR